MRLYLNIGSIPELRRFAPEQRRAIWFECRLMSAFEPVVILAGSLCGVLGWAGREVACRLSGSLLSQATGIAVGAVIGGIILHVVATRRTRRRILNYGH